MTSKMKRKIVKYDKFVNGYYFNVIKTSPVIGNNLNFYSKYANYDGNSKFFNTMFLIEKIYYIKDLLKDPTKNDAKDDAKNLEESILKYNMKLNEEQQRIIYLNLMFKIDTLHDFNDGSRTTIDNNKTFDINSLKELLKWDSFTIKKIITKIKKLIYIDLNNVCSN